MPKKEVSEYFLTVGIEENRIIATVALISGKEVSIIGTGESQFSDTSEETEAADIAISAAEKKIGEDVLVQKVVFGLPFSLLDNDKIKPQHLARLKKITKTLSLTPCGFIEYPQALSYYLEMKEESPPTLLLMSIGKEKITFSHIRVGKIEKNVIVDRTSSFTADFEKSLSDFSSSEILPSRIMLYDESGDELLDKISEELLKFPWHKHSTFLHTPKIETLETQALSFALVETAAKSLTHDLELQEEEKTESPKVRQEKKEEVHEEETFGFVKGEDVGEKSEEQPQTHTGLSEEVEQTKEVETPSISFETNKEENLSVPQKESIFAKLPRFNISLPQMSFAKLPAIGLILGILLVLALLFSIFWYYPKTNVNLIVYPASSASKIDVLFTTNPDSITSGKNTILASTVSEEIEGNKTGAASGKTKIGEKATGSVTIYNKTLASKTFPKGTTVIGENLKFTLNDDATVASASDTGEGLTFGKTTAQISAFDIGPDGNLVANTNFNFKDFDKASYYAKNSEKFTGGTSRDITSVSKDDQDQLLSSLTGELTTKAKQQMIQKLGPGEKLLDVPSDNTAVSKKFGKNVGEESKELSLSLTLKVNSLVYKENDLTDLTRDNSTQVPPGFTLASEKTHIRIDEAKTNKTGDVVGIATITYYFFPKIETNDIRSRISGKTFGDVDKYLSTVQNIGGVEIISASKLPFFTNRLPYRGGNININLVSR